MRPRTRVSTRLGEHLLHPRSIFAALCILFSLALLAGCGGGGGGGNGGACNDPTSLCGSDPTTLTLSKATPEHLTATLTQSQSTISTTGTVTYTVTLLNTTSSPVNVVTYNDATGQPTVPAGLTITDSLGTVVYPYQGSSNPPTPSQVTLAPNQSITATVTTFTPTHQGRFLASATFSFNGNNTVVGPLTVTAR